MDNSVNEYLQALESILKKNRGTRMNTLYDTDPNIPDQLQTASPYTPRQDYGLSPDYIDQVQYASPSPLITNTPQRQGAVLGASSPRPRPQPQYSNYDTQGQEVFLPELQPGEEFQQEQPGQSFMPRDPSGRVIQGPQRINPQTTRYQTRYQNELAASMNAGRNMSPADRRLVARMDPTGSKANAFIGNAASQIDESAYIDERSLNTADEYLQMARRAMESGNMQEAQVYTDAATKIIDSAYQTTTATDNITQSMGTPSQRPETLEPQDLGSRAASYIEKANPTGNFDLGITEYMRGQPNQAEEKQRQTAQNVGQGIENLGKSFNLPELGISEGISQLPQNAKDVSNVFAKALAQAGQGVSGLKDSLNTFQENIFQKKDPASIGPRNAIGENSSGSVATSLGDMQSKPGGNRSQDPFFSGGGYDTYKGELNPNVTKGYRGALDINLFKDSFFQNPDNVANVFGSTSRAKEATDKYRNYLSTQYPIKPGGESPTIKKTQSYLDSYDGLMVDGEYWRDNFARTGKDENSGEGKAFQQREAQNQKTQEYEDVNPIYYENEYNRSVLQSVPEKLQSSFKFSAPRSSAPMSKPQGLYQPVTGDQSVAPDATMSRSTPQTLPSNIFRPQGKMQSMPSVLGASITKQSTPRPVPTPLMTAPVPTVSKASLPSISKQKASNYTAPRPEPVPTPTQSYSAPKQAVVSKPTYSAPVPKPAPRPVPAPKPAPKPAAKQQTNIFQNLLNYLSRR